MRLASVLILALVLPCVGQSVATESLPLLPDSPTAVNSAFGTRLAAHGDWMAIGADHDLNDFPGVGEVHVLQFIDSGWQQHQRLTAPDGFVGDHFGLPVLLGSDVLVVGAPTDDDLGFWSGSAYVYRRIQNEWTFEAKLLPPLEDNTYALFGLTMCFGLDESEVIIGAYLESTDAHTSGAVYVFKKTNGGWAASQRLSLPDAQTAAYFGRSVSVSENRLAVGISGAKTNTSPHPHGTVRSYRHNGSTWEFESELLPPVPEQYQAFGEWVDLNGDLLSVSSPGESATLAQSRGINYVFRWDLATASWTVVSRLEPPTPMTTAFSFPTAFSPDGSLLLVGAYSSSSYGTNSGAAWIYQLIDGVFTAPVELTRNRPEPGDFFGLAVAFHNNVAYVAAPRLDQAGENSGGVFRFALHDCTDSGVLDAWEISQGIATDLNGNGIPDSCDARSPDVNHDGIVNGGDIGIIMGAWGTDGSIGCDLDGNGIVDGADLAMILVNWG